MPRSIALWITLRDFSRSVRWPKLLQPRPTAETRRPEPPRLRICMTDPVVKRSLTGNILARRDAGRKPHTRRAGSQKMIPKTTRPRSDAATDGDRWALDL